jgi:hypothetical protein
VTQIIAAFILAGGAFYGVYKGAVYAVDRLSAQLGEERRLSEERLDAEAKRLQMQLDAEAERLDRQLAHDRWIREVEELRRIVDEAAATGLSAANAVNDFRAQVRWHVEDEGSPNEMYATKRRDARLAVEATQGYVERFEVRMGRDPKLPQAMSDWQVAVEEAFVALEEIPPTEFSLKDGGRMLSLSAGRYLAFMEAARSYVRLDPAEQK